MKLFAKTYVLFFLMLGALLSQDFSGIKIYINPGHGGHDPANDRYIPATGFWESEGNLTKGLRVREILKNLGATVYISRTQNRDADDRSLSEIDAEANANTVDYFHSIHSNAFNESSNYTVLIYKETNGIPETQEAVQMSQIMSPEIHKANRTTSARVWGDYSHLGYHLGVLNYLDMPGTLSEGSFHDYVPESWRLQSMEYRKHEATAIVRAFVDYFNLQPSSYGVIAGLTRDKNKNVSYTYNTGLPNDRKKPVNYADITLLPTGQTYRTDGNNNGFFIFDSLQPGDYRVVFDAGDYQTDTVSVTVQANKTVFADAFLTADPDKAPFVRSYSPEDSSADFSTYDSFSIEFSRPMNTTSVENTLSILPYRSGSVSWREANRELVFSPDTAFAEHTEYLVQIADSVQSSSGAYLQNEFMLHFTTADSHDYPQIVSYFPAEDSVFTNTHMEITFSQWMKAEQGAEAFRIEPAVDGTLEWQANNTKLIFTPDELLKNDRIYTVLVFPQIENRYSVSLQDTFKFTLKTRKFNWMKAGRTFPENNQTGIEITMSFSLRFDYQLDASTFSADNLKLSNETGESVPFTNLRFEQFDDHTNIVFKPKKDLNTNTSYTVFLYPEFASQEGFIYKDTLRVDFKTGKNKYASGTVINPFEEAGNWLGPLKDTYTIGIDSAKTTFYRSGVYKRNGYYSGLLKYAFRDDSLGYCRIKNINRPSLGSDSASEFGLWVFGDVSGNTLELWFDHGDSLQASVVADPLNWYGWKLVRFPLSQIGGNGEVFFQAVGVRQLAGAEREGALYIDDAQTDVLVGIGEAPNPSVAKEFKLYHNYPNPFNPSTTIRYRLSAAGSVKVTVFDLLGRKIITLIQKPQTAGEHTVRWNGKNNRGALVASGIYIYQLQAGEHTARKKMILLR